MSSDPHQIPSPDPSPRRRGRRRILLFALVAIVGLLTALFSFGLSRDPTIVRSALIGRAAPDFTLQTLDGAQTVRLSDLRGQVVVVNFWASWCADCLIEHSALEAAWQRYRDQGVVFVGIPFQDAPSASKAYLRYLRFSVPQCETVAPSVSVPVRR